MTKKDTSDKFNAVPEDFVFLDANKNEADLWNILGRPLEKARKYIPDPSQAPKGAKVQRGPKGGYYYESSRNTSEKEKPIELTEDKIRKRLSDAGIEPDPEDCIGTSEAVAETLGGKLVIGYYTDPYPGGGVLLQPHVWNKVGKYTIDATASQIPDSDTDLVITTHSHPDADEIIEIAPEEIGDYDIAEVLENRRKYWGDDEDELEKARKYISDPSQAPKGVKVQRGKKGGYYYEAEPMRTSLKTQPDEVKRAVKDKYNEGLDAKQIAMELEEEHGVKVHPETVNRFLEREGISVRPKRETVSRRDVEAQQKTIEEQAKQIEDMSSKLKALKSDVDFYKEKYTALDKENAAMKQEIANLRAMYEALKKPEGEATEETKPEEEKEPEPPKKETEDEKLQRQAAERAALFDESRETDPGKKWLHTPPSGESETESPKPQVGDFLTEKAAYTKWLNNLPSGVPGVPDLQREFSKLRRKTYKEFTIPFGKYKGKSIESVRKTDIGYIKWLQTCDDAEIANAAFAVLVGKPIGWGAVPPQDWRGANT